MVCYYIGKDTKLAIGVDVRTIATIMAINLGIYKVKGSGLTMVDEYKSNTFFDTKILDKGHFYVDVSRKWYVRENSREPVFYIYLL